MFLHVNHDGFVFLVDVLSVLSELEFVHVLEDLGDDVTVVTVGLGILDSVTQDWSVRHSGGRYSLGCVTGEALIRLPLAAVSDILCGRLEGGSGVSLGRGGGGVASTLTRRNQDVRVALNVVGLIVGLVLAGGQNQYAGFVWA